MPEKTLKEKVDAARIIGATLGLEDDRVVQEALTALEERVEELELTVNLYREADSIHWPRPLTATEISIVGIQPKEQEAPDGK